MCCAIVVAHLFLARATRDLGWGWYLAVAYGAGATMAQALFLAVHELTHNLFFASPRANRAFALLLVNGPLVVPFCASFRGYHLAHHKRQGERGRDADLPSEREARWVGRSGVRKAVWLSFQIVAYAVRPWCVRPEPLTLSLAANWATQAVWNAAIVLAGGWSSLAYLALSVLLAGGMFFHPCAGHFVAEHYLLHEEGGQETFSYYGPLNWLTWNVGYHVEHHDLSNVPGSRLPSVRAIAPEFYSGLRTCPSWTGAMWRFVTDPRVGLDRRVVRQTPVASRR